MRTRVLFYVWPRLEPAGNVHAAGGRHRSPIPAVRRVCHRGGQWRYRSTSSARSAPRSSRVMHPHPRRGAGSQVGEHEELEGNGGAQQCRDGDGLQRRGPQCAPACSGLGRLRPGPGRAGGRYIKLKVAHAGVQAILLLLGLRHLRLVLGLLQPAAHLVPVGLGTCSLGSVVRLRLRLRRQARVRVRACRLLVLHTNDACCSAQPCGDQRAGSSSVQ